MTQVVASSRYMVTQETIDRWAEVSGDFNPLHVSPDYAASTRFGTTIAHGHYGLAQLEALLLETLGETWLRGGLLRDLKFRSPVRPGTECLAELHDNGTDGEYDVTVTVEERGESVVAFRGRAVVGGAVRW